MPSISSEISFDDSNDCDIGDYVNQLPHSENTVYTQMIDSISSGEDFPLAKRRKTTVK